MPPKLKAMIATLAGLMTPEPAERNNEEISKALSGLADYENTDEAKGYAGTEKLAKEIADIKAAQDKTVEDLRDLRKRGLRANSAGRILIPGGRQARREMIADGRCFLDDEAAMRFGASMAVAAFKLWGLEDRLPKYVKEIAEDVCKQNLTVRAEKADMDPGVDAAGAYVIADEFISELIRNVEAEGKVFTRCRRIPLATMGTTSIPKRTAGLGAYWLAAATQITRTAPTFGLIQLTPEKLGVLVGVPNEFLRASLLIDLGNFLGLEIVHEISRKLDDALVNGDGTADYGGITGILQSANITAVVAASTHTSMATIDGTDVSNVIGGLAVDYAIGEAEWGASLSVIMNMRALKATTGVPLYERGDGDRMPASIDGFPFFFTPRSTASGSVTTSTLYAWFGDLRRSHIVGMIRSIEIARSEHVLFESDMTAIRGILHVDATEQDATAIVTAKTAAS